MASLLQAKLETRTFKAMRDSMKGPVRHNFGSSSDTSRRADLLLLSHAGQEFGQRPGSFREDAVGVASSESAAYRFVTFKTDVFPRNYLSGMQQADRAGRIVL